jgi:hypothetical protein
MTDATAILEEIARRRNLELRLFCRYGHLPHIFPEAVRELENQRKPEERIIK